MTGTKWITYQGHKILYVDYRTRNPAEQVDVLEEVGKLILDNSPGVRNLSDFRGAPISASFMKRAKELNVTAFGPQKMRLALLGIDGIKLVLLKGFNAVSHSASNGVPFSTEEEAYQYLIR